MALSLRSSHASLDAQLVDRDTYLKLAENLEGFLTRLRDTAGAATIEDRQKVLRSVVKEVRHVQHEPGQVDGEDLDHAGHDAPLDLDQLVRGDGVHRVPEAPVVGVKISDTELAALPLTRHDWHGEWNYTLAPTNPSKPRD